MTAIFDGHLIVRVGGKGIEPCCDSMNRAVILGAVYRGTTGKKPCVSMRMSGKTGIPICVCPFCRANVEVVG